MVIIILLNRTLFGITGERIAPRSDQTDCRRTSAISDGIFKPEASQSIGNILFFVKPGIVFISFSKILFEDFSIKKSTLA
ncbi:MAG: hypothetical protein VXZ24_11215, partial [Pseudomonadota bacterium]|nr:hypothetical protein [Pseudomonadota bacterium]